LTSLGEINFSIIREKVDDILTVSEESIIEAMRMIWERMKIIIEPSSAVPLAALLSKKTDLQKMKRIGIILSGGNVDLGKLPF
jgi:threonine dehydratase